MTLSPTTVSEHLARIVMEPMRREKILQRTRAIIRKQLPALERWIHTHDDIFTYIPPVAAAIAGLALGGGGELALASHHRVMVDDPKAAFGLPESLVGLLPGAGGTQRLPRLTGIEKALPVLLEGARLSGQAAIAAGVVDQLVPGGEEVAAAERWVLSNASASQPWDRPGWRPADVDRLAAIIERKRESVLAETLGHYPAPLAILDCVSQGLSQPFDEAIRTEMQIFSKLIQRREPRNMIRTLFFGRLDHDRLRKAGSIPAPVE